MRPPHILRGNKSTSHPTRIVLFDTETRGDHLPNGAVRHTLRLGVACYWRRREDGVPDTRDYFTFRTEDAFWDWVTSQVHDRTRTVCSSHNLGFDLPILHAFQALPERGFALKSFYSKGMTTLVRFRRGKGTLEFVDNTNYFAGRLADLGTVVGMEKLEVDFEAVDLQALEVYCKRDVDILCKLWATWFAFLDEHDLGTWGRTLPSQSFHAFRHRFMSHKIAIHNDEPASKLERSGYRGGRVEVLKVGEYRGGPFYKLDVNSMYPYAMRNFDYPTCLYKYIENPSVVYLEYKLERYHVVAECLIETTEPAFPHSVGGHVSYPIGRFKTTLTTEELRFLSTCGQVLEVYRMAYYRGEPIFRRYVDYFYPLKVKYTQEGNIPFRLITKGFLNYLYGKFGQRGTKDTPFGTCPAEEFRIVEGYDIPTKRHFQLIHIAGQIIRRDVEEESYNSFPAIAAEVTANARLYLHRLLTVAGRQHTLYMDTDSLIVDQQGFDALGPHIAEHQLGQMKLEGTSDYLHIRAPKDYTFGDIVRIKGVRSNARRLAPNVYRQARFPSIAGLLRTSEQEEYIVTQTTKHLAREIFTGNVLPSGEVAPFLLSEAP